MTFFSIDIYSLTTTRHRFRPNPHPLFHFYRLSVSIYTDPHQSPIRFKAIVFYAKYLCCMTMLKMRPLVYSDPRKSSVPYRVQLFLSQILWLLANPLWTHGIGESRSKQRFAAVDGHCSCQSGLMV